MVLPQSQCRFGCAKDKPESGARPWPPAPAKRFIPKQKCLYCSPCWRHQLLGDGGHGARTGQDLETPRSMGHAVLRGFSESVPEKK